MQTLIRGRTLRPTLKNGWLIALLVFCCSPASRAEQPSHNVLCRPEMALSRRAELTDKLRMITGWHDLKFDENGALRLGGSKSAGGSQTARDLLTAAVAGKNVIVLEDASNRADVVFCRVIEGRWTHDRQGQPPVYIVLIDFADFSHLMGEEAARSAFNVGWGVMHEIDHVVHDSVDAVKNGEVGECEDLINRMRRECGVPERADYYYEFLPAAQNSDFKTRFVRLPFDVYKSETNKKSRYWLIWDASLVGGIEEQQRLAARL